MLAGRDEVALARANLFPRIDASVDATERKVGPRVQAGQAAERTTTAGIGLSQPLYVDDAWAGLAIERLLQDNREASQRQLELDIFQETANAYFNVLRAEAQLRIQRDNLSTTRDNLTLAEQRVQVGAANASDAYRWQSRLANTRADLQFAQSQLRQAVLQLNRLVNRPVGAATSVNPVDIDTATGFTESDFNTLIRNPARFEFFIEFQVALALENAPEVTQIEALIAAKAREIVNIEREAWLPEFAIGARAGETLSTSGIGASDRLEAADWSVGVSATLPIDLRGQRRRSLSRAKNESSQLELAYESARSGIELRYRAAATQAIASYSSIDLAQQSADAARSNLELVTDAYRQGAVSIIELLDAQNASVTAEAASANAVYDFLIDIMATERARGDFAVLEDPAVLAARSRDLIRYIDDRVQQEGVR